MSCDGEEARTGEEEVRTGEEEIRTGEEEVKTGEEEDRTGEQDKTGGGEEESGSLSLQACLSHVQYLDTVVFHVTGHVDYILNTLVRSHVTRRVPMS